MKRFSVPDCYVPVADRIRQYAETDIDLLAITDHDVPLVFEDKEWHQTEALLEGRSKPLHIVSGEEITVGVTSENGSSDGLGAHVLVLFRGLHPHNDRKRILRTHAQLHRHSHDAIEFFRHIRSRDDVIAILAHPFAGPLRLGGSLFYRLLSDGAIQRIEAFNGGETTMDQNRFARAVADAFDLGVISSDDQHRRWEGLRNFTYSPATGPTQFLDDLAAGRTTGTAVHSPTYPRKYLELLEGFYLGYLPMYARQLPGSIRSSSDVPWLSQLTLTAIASLVWCPAVLVGMIRYLRRGERQSRTDFSELAALEPRLYDALSHHPGPGIN